MRGQKDLGIIQLFKKILEITGIKWNSCSLDASSTMAEVESVLFKPDVSKLGTDQIKYLNIDVLYEDTIIP